MSWQLIRCAALICVGGCGRLGFDELTREVSEPPVFVRAAEEPDASLAPPKKEGERDAGIAPSCARELPPARWFRFDGIGAEIVDARGGPSGRAYSSGQDGLGGIDIDNALAYVALPRVILRRDAPLTSIYWITWNGGEDKQTLSYVEKPWPSWESDEDPASVALSLVSGVLTLRYETVLGAQEIVADRALAPGRQTQVASVYDAASAELTLYVDGAQVAHAPLEPSMTEVIFGQNVWLGRGAAAEGERFAGRFEDLRVLEATLSECQIAAAYAAGPDAPLLCAACE